MWQVVSGEVKMVDSYEFITTTHNLSYWSIIKKIVAKVAILLLLGLGRDLDKKLRFFSLFKKEKEKVLVFFLKYTISEFPKKKKKNKKTQRREEQQQAKQQKKPTLKPKWVCGGRLLQLVESLWFYFIFLFLHPENHRTEAIKPLSKTQKAYRSHDGYA